MLTDAVEEWRKYLKYALIARSPGTYWKYRTWRRGWAEPELPLLPRLCAPEQIAIDVGANLGLYTHQLSHLARVCHSFEAAPELVAILRKAYPARDGRVVVHHVALADEPGTVELRIPVSRRFQGYSTIEADNDIGAKVDLSAGLRRISVEARTLDSFSLTGVGFIKIDVEGAEQRVLAGARALLRREQPIVLVEVEDRHKQGSVNGVMELMRDLGYSGFFVRDGGLVPSSEFDLRRNQDEARPDLYVRNFTFLTEAHRARLRDLLRDH